MTSGSEFHGEDTARPRKQWALEPSDSVMEVLANASLMSSESMVSMNQIPTGCTHEGIVTIISTETYLWRKWNIIALLAIGFIFLSCKTFFFLAKLFTKQQSGQWRPE